MDEDWRGAQLRDHTDIYGDSVLFGVHSPGNVETLSQTAPSEASDFMGAAGAAPSCESHGTAILGA
jgi:hypothetical protein